MASPAEPLELSLQASTLAPDARDLLRFITCGSVDDGKSTLIGRLLFDSGQLTDDQLTTLEVDSARSGTASGSLDLALVLDGLAAEREQGITIDVAYRFFATPKRSFIVADTPGHEQYTRNMATGASTAEAAVLLVDARKGLSRQTRRHSLIVSTLGIRHVILAVNKMDLVGWSHDIFEAIKAEYRDFAKGLGFAGITAIPLSAKLGDNVTRRSDATPWYAGPDLLSALETIEIGPAAGSGSFRLPVQWVNRPDAEFRGFAGLVTGRSVRPGQEVVVLPGGQTTRVARIVTYDGDLDRVLPGQSVTLTLADEVDVSRGTVIADRQSPMRVTDRLTARLFWMGKAPARQGAVHLAKIGAQSAVATVTAVRSRVDLQSAEPHPAEALEANDLGDLAITFDRLVCVDDFGANPDTGSFILVEPGSYETVAMGLVLEDAEEREREAEQVARSWSPAIRHWLPAPFATPWRSVLKTATWRLTGTGLTVAAAWWLIGDPGTAMLLGLFELVVKFGLQFGHERLWTHIGIGLLPAPALGHCHPSNS